MCEICAENNYQGACPWITRRRGGLIEKMTWKKCAGCKKSITASQPMDYSRETGVYLHNNPDCLLEYAHEELAIQVVERRID